MNDENDDVLDGEIPLEEMTPEQALGLVLINKVRKKKTSVELQDETGDTVELASVVQELLNYIKVKLETGEESQFSGQIMPLMSQALVSGLGRLIGIPMTAFYLADDVAKMSMIHMMCVAFLMLKFVQQKKLTINTFEEDVSDEEIEEMSRKSKANSIATLGAMAGQNPKEVLQALKDQGTITDQDLKDMLGEKKGL